MHLTLPLADMMGFNRTHEDRTCGSGSVCFEMTMLLLMSTKSAKVDIAIVLFQHHTIDRAF